MLHSLSVRNFRNLDIPYQKFRFGVTVLVGNNGQGKSNILESIYLLSYGKLLRGVKADAVNWHEEDAQVTGETDKDTLTVVIGKSKESRVLVNNKNKGATDLVGRFISVLFRPTEIDVVTGPPQVRRAWLDRTISTADKKYLFDLINYHKVLKGRNRLLKLGKSGTEEMRVWDTNLAGFGLRLWSRRKESIEEFNQTIQKEARRIVGKQIKVVYSNPTSFGTQSETERIFLKGLSDSRRLEERFLVTVFGPHRDDFSLVSEETIGHTVLEKSIAAFGSRGEQRQAAILLKLTEAGFFYRAFKKSPTVLLDDVTSELDEANRDLLLSNLVGKQVLITTTDLASISPKIKSKADILRVDEGRIRPA